MEPKVGLCFPLNQRKNSPKKNKQLGSQKLFEFSVAKFSQYHFGNNRRLLKTAGKSLTQIKIFKANSTAWLEIYCSFTLLRLLWFYVFKIYIHKCVVSVRQVMYCFKTLFFNFNVIGRTFRQILLNKTSPCDENVRSSKILSFLKRIYLYHSDVRQKSYCIFQYLWLIHFDSSSKIYQACILEKIYFFFAWVLKEARWKMQIIYWEIFTKLKWWNYL